jgi:hypothetical protein
MPDQEDVTTEETEETEDAGESGTGQDGDGLGDKGRETLRKEREARKAADKERKALRAELEALKAQQAAGAQQDEAQKAADQARRDAEQAATAKANQRILRSEVKAAAAGKLNDPADALAHIDLSQFEPDADGEFDGAEIAEAISDLIKRKPYLGAKPTGFQGTGDGGARTSGSKPRQVTEAELKTMSAAQIVKARQEGRLANVMGG